MLDKGKVDTELARRFCAAFVSYQLGVSIATQYKRTPEEVGDLWYFTAGRPKPWWQHPTSGARAGNPRGAPRESMSTSKSHGVLSTALGIPLPTLHKSPPGTKASPTECHGIELRKAATEI
jgi:hypothetical protein